MKLFLVLALAFNFVFSAPAPQDSNNVQIIRYDNDNDGIESYNFVLEQSDGTIREEKGTLKNKGSENAAIAVVGKYSWVAPDGVTYTVTYTADENGYQPQLQASKSQKGPSPTSIPAGVVATLINGK